MNDDDIEIINMSSVGGGSASYTTMLKELVESISMTMKWDKNLKAATDTSNSLYELLQKEINLQLMVQEDEIISYKAERAKKNIQSVKEKVVPIK